ncbi:MAG TPA: pyridoxal-phosphate dependent enzyme [Longimicrobiales bacterium]|nr:pyridoxal-phosphate dependent enzyme [Longimicrobiales bacterium]
MSDSERSPLFRRFPDLAGRLPWQPLGKFPTRVDRVTVRTPDGSDRTFFVKREDLCGDVYGGNKVRKLEFLLPEAKRRGARRLITVGAAGSHHALATTVHGTASGFGVTVVLFPQDLTDHVRDILLMDQALGAEIRWVRRMEFVPFAMWHARLSWRHEQPFVVAAGGSDATGTLGWVGAGLELAEQIARGECPVPPVIHVAAGTLGTAAGLALGLAIAGVDTRIAASRITSRIITNEHALGQLVRGAAALLHSAGDMPVQRAIDMVEIRHGQIGRGYGRTTPEAENARRAFADAELMLDGTYTAKAAAELLASEDDEDTLFINTLSSVEPLDRVAPGTVTELPDAVAAYLADGGTRPRD